MLQQTYNKKRSLSLQDVMKEKKKDLTFYRSILDNLYTCCVQPLHYTSKHDKDTCHSSPSVSILDLSLPCLSSGQRCLL